MLKTLVQAVKNTKENSQFSKKWIFYDFFKNKPPKLRLSGLVFHQYDFLQDILNIRLYIYYLVENQGLVRPNNVNFNDKKQQQKEFEKFNFSKKSSCLSFSSTL